MIQQLFKGVMARLGVAGAAEADTDVESAIFDTAGFRGIAFLGRIAVADDDNYLTVVQGDEDDLSDGELASVKAVAQADGDLCLVDIYRPQKRYFQAVIKRGEASATGDLLCFRYTARGGPVDNEEAGEIVSSLVVSPEEDD